MNAALWTLTFYRLRCPECGEWLDTCKREFAYDFTEAHAGHEGAYGESMPLVGPVGERAR